MKKVSVESLKPGVKLAKPVVNDSGMIIIGDGTVLSDVHIDRLHNMNISTVYVEGTAGPLKNKEELLAELDARFTKTEEEPYMSILKKALREQIEGMSA